MGTLYAPKFFRIPVETSLQRGRAILVHPPAIATSDLPWTALQKPAALAQSRFCSSPRGGTIAEPYHVHPNYQPVTLVLWASFVNIQLLPALVQFEVPQP